MEISQVHPMIKVIASTMLLLSISVASVAAKGKNVAHQKVALTHWETVDGRTNSGGRLLIDTTSLEVYEHSVSFYYQTHGKDGFGRTRMGRVDGCGKSPVWTAETGERKGQKQKYDWVPVAIDSPAARDLVVLVCRYQFTTERDRCVDAIFKAEEARDSVQYADPVVRKHVGIALNREISLRCN
jgi:hypothetical protein